MRCIRAVLGIQIHYIAYLEVHIARKMIVRNLCAHCVVVAGLTKVGMILNKVIATGEHCNGEARIYRVQARTLDCSLDLQWPVVCGTPVVFGEQPWKSFQLGSSSHWPKS